MSGKKRGWQSLVEPVTATALSGPNKGETVTFKPYSRKYLVVLRRQIQHKLGDVKIDENKLGPAARAWETWEKRANPSFESIDWIVDALNRITRDHQTPQQKHKRVAAPDQNNPNQIIAAQGFLHEIATLFEWGYTVLPKKRAKYK